MQTWDVVVIGAGPVGENVADRAVAGGLSAVVIESELVGGECSYWACMPSKALLRSGAVRRAAAQVSGSGVHGHGIDVDAVLKRRNSFASGWDDAGQVRWLDGAGIDLIRGHGRLVGERRVQITTADGVQEIEAKYAVAVCTGTDAFVPESLAPARPWTSREAVSAEEMPARLAIVGGGVVGVEMATAYRDLGAQVTLLVRGEVLAGQEPFAGEFVTAALEASGVEVRTGVTVQGATRDETGVHLTCADGRVVDADEVLVATGRTPRTEDLGLDSVGLVDGDWLSVDETMLVTGTDWLYAVGDVNHRSLLTHQGKYQARAAGDVIVARATGLPVADEAWSWHVATADHEAVPQVTFSDPEVASVGLTAKAAQEKYPVRAIDIELGSIAGAGLHADKYSGRVRAVIDTDREVLVGMTFVGQDVGEMLHAATIAVVGEVPLTRLWHAVPSYPTISEVWLRVLEAYGRTGPTGATPS